MFRYGLSLFFVIAALGATAWYWEGEFLCVQEESREVLSSPDGRDTLLARRCTRSELVRESLFLVPSSETRPKEQDEIVQREYEVIDVEIWAETEPRPPSRVISFATSAAWVSDSALVLSHSEEVRVARFRPAARGVAIRLQELK